MAILFHDDFNGSGNLNGHAPDVNVLGAGGVWTGGGVIAQLSGGYLHATPGVGNYVSGSIFEDAGQGVIGQAAKITFRWTPGGTQADYADYTYPLGINFQSAMLWMTANAGSVSMVFASGGESASAGAVFSAGTAYDGTITIEDGHQTLSFLGHVLELTAAIDVSTIAVQPIYLNIGTTADGSASGALDFLKIESLAAPLFWTNLRNAQEVS